MSIVVLLARILLAVVFLVAGFAKLADLPGSQKAIRDFGVPASLANPFGLLLPLAEIVVALALILTISAWWAAIGALLLLLLFVAGISYNLAQGRTPDCHCFGQLHSAPVGWPTLIRNAILAAIAVFVIVFGYNNIGPGVLDWLNLLQTYQRIEVLAGVVLLALLVLEGWLLWQMLRQQGRLLLRIEALEAQLSSNGKPVQSAIPGSSTSANPEVGLPMDTPAPAFSLPDLNGETITLDALRELGKPIILIFSDPGCGPCTALLPEAARWQRDYAGKLTLAFISRGTLKANQSKANENRVTRVLLQRDREVSEQYQAIGTPSAVFIRTDGTIGSSVAQGADAIRALVAGAVGLPMLKTSSSVTPTMLPITGNGSAKAVSSSQPVRLKIGDPAPTFTLPDLTGNSTKLADFKGNDILLLFWNPGCGFCQRMLEDLKAWEANPPTGAPKLLLVSTGSAEANQAMGLRSPILLDQNFSTGHTFNATGTPMAVLIDAQGNIASDVVAGAPAVLALADTDNVPAKSATF
jgi:peroxiredoxin/uncharacterized membrane protein YphA (DoxX/SURF4 family)